MSLVWLRVARAVRGLQHALVELPTADSTGSGSFVSIVVPARNEELVIDRCVRSLLAQRYGNFEVIALNDRSTDRTRGRLEAIAATEEPLRILDGEPLPEGWVGKCWAAFQAAQAAHGDWLLFVDADTYYQPAALASAVAFAERHQVDLLSLGPRQELGTFWERALLPAIFGIILTAGGPISEVNDPTRPLAKAIGQFMLFRTSTYWAIGGHETVKDEIVDDFALARRVKGTGHHLRLASGRDLVSTRMYHSLPEIWEGFSKNSYAEARRQPTGVVEAIVLPWLTIALPPLFGARALSRLLTRRRASWLELSILIQSALQIGMLMDFAVQAVRLVRLSPFWALTVPPGLLFFSAVMVNSTLRVLSGRGVTWKGRSYGLRPQP